MLLSLILFVGILMTQTKRKPESSAATPKAPEAGLGSLVKSLLPLAMIFGIRSLPLDEAQLLLLARVAFSVKVVVVMILCAFMGYKIVSSKSEEKVKAHEKVIGFGGQTELIPEMTVAEYDRHQLIEFIKKEGIQTAMMIFFHIQWGFVQPMLLSTVVGLMPLLDNQLVKLYVLGHTVSRPFEDKSAQQAGPFAALFAPSAPEDGKKDD